MRLNHLNLCVDDLEAGCQFFTDYFAFQVAFQPGPGLAVLTGDDGFVLVLSTARSRTTPLTYPGGFHIGFLQSTPAEVDRIYERLAQAGFIGSQKPREIHRSYGFYATVLGGLMIEVSCNQL